MLDIGAAMKPRAAGMETTLSRAPNCPGVITPAARARAGIMPTDVYLEGSVGVISRSGTLVYETVDQLTRAGIGQSSSVGVGGDPIIGTTQAEALALFEADPDTAAVVLIGEIGGTAEQEAAAYVAQMSKPVTAFIAGAPPRPGVAWATPARSSPARPAPPTPRRPPSARPAQWSPTPPRRSARRAWSSCGAPGCCSESLVTPADVSGARGGKLEGKVAVVTGGTSGIGLAVARLFLARGRARRRLRA